MSFFRNFRTKTRSKSSSRDTTPVNTNSRPGSVLSNGTTHTNGSASARRESIDSRTDSLLNRSDTFILDSDQEAEDKESKQNSSNNSTLEKKSKKSKVLGKFATFTKRKKTPPAPEKANDPLEHHPNDNATNTYYKWRSDGPASTHTLDYDTQTDPFQFLYEQHSSLKDMKKGNNSSSNGSANGSIHSTHSSNGTHEQQHAISQHQHPHNQPFDSSTFRKGKMPAQLKEQLSQLKTQTKSDLHEAEELAAEPESTADKYKTVTLNSFRKSFREKFIQNQNNPAHNPAWFVEVEPPKVETRARCESKENRPDFLVFDNDNYRPNSRSPVREGKERTARSGSRSPVKRNETFRMERPSTWDKSARKGSPERHKGIQTPEVPSIRIEIKNSISPNMPTRVVPVGVAKPMPAQDSYQRASARSAGGGITVSDKAAKSGDREKSPLRNWAKPITVTPVRYPSSAKPNGGNNTSQAATNGRYQTLVQIRNETNAKSLTPTQSSATAAAASNRSRHSTRIQLGGGIVGGSPTLQKRLNTPGTRHSLATPLQMNALRSYELLKNTTPIVGSKSVSEQQSSSLRKLQQPKHTYFGDTSTQTSANGNSNKTTISTTTFSMGRVPNHSTTTTHTTTTTTTSNYPSLASRLQQPQVVRVAGGGGGGGSASSNYQNRSQQQQQRVLLPLQRRSRSPIKMPWR